MVKALDYESRDSRFDSWCGRFFCLFLENFLFFDKPLFSYFASRFIVNIYCKIIFFYFLMENWTWNTKRKRQDEEEEVVLKYCKIEENVLDLKCNLSPFCSQLKAFNTYTEYDNHYALFHLNNCSLCHRVLPTKHLLHLHILEIHDSYFLVKSERENMFECFVDNCMHLSKNSFDRKEHLISVHLYPKKFDFDVILGTKTPRPKKSKRKEKEIPPKMMIDLENSMSNLTMVPRQVSFGRKQKSGFSI
jgi:hypothetical protein